MNSELFLALQSGSLTKVQDLYNLDTRVLFEVTFQGDTSLHIAARKGHVDLVRWILQVSPSLAGAENKDNNTPLHEAAKTANHEVAEFLLCRQSYVYHFNKFGETALILALQYGCVETARRLLQARLHENAFEWDRSIREAAYRGYTDVVVAMLDNPVRTSSDNASSEDRHVPETLNLSISVTPILHTAVRRGHLKTVRAMINHRWWENTLMTEEDEGGRCAVHVAAMKGNWSIISEFMSKMPDCLEIRSSDHKSVLHFAVEYNQPNLVMNLLEEREREVRELVSYDHDLSGNTPLHLAATNGVDRQVSFFSHGEEATSNPKVDPMFFIPRENPRALSIRKPEQSSPSMVLKPVANLEEVAVPINDHRTMGQDSNGIWSFVNDAFAHEPENAKQNWSGGVKDANIQNNSVSSKLVDGPIKLSSRHNGSSPKQNHRGNGYISSSGHRAGKAAIVYAHNVDIGALMPKLPHSDYYTAYYIEPKIAELAAKERAEPGYRYRVKDFVVGRRGYGYIKFLGETNVRQLDLEDTVEFNKAAIFNRCLYCCG